MNWLQNGLILGAAFVAVFAETAFTGLRRALGAQIDLLPPLMVYAALTAGSLTVLLLACVGGICLDSLSANPLGLSVPPLLLTGLFLHYHRGLMLRNNLLTRYVMGFAASTAVPAMTLLSLVAAGGRPLIGWWSLWQWVLMALGGAAITPVLFLAFDRLLRALNYPVAREPSFRSDREIQRRRLPDHE